MVTNPASTLLKALEAENWSLISDNALNRFQHSPHHVLQMLIYLQTALGYIPPALQSQIARDLQLPITHIQGLMAFYFFLSAEKLGKYRIYISNNITDKMLGADALTESLCQQLNVSLGCPRTDGKVYIEQSSCIGLSDQGPSCLINGLSIPSLNAERIKQIVSLIESDTELSLWPKSLFEVSDSIHRKDWFLNNTTSTGEGLSKTLSIGEEKSLALLEKSGLRGRGGAGFPTAKKWRFCKNTPAEKRVVVCNADEGEPGTFKDRVLLRQHSDSILEGMTICARIIGAELGFIYLRAEYLYLLPDLEKALQKRRDNNLLGQAILGNEGFNFDIEIHLGAGAYICGEESALIESLEGKRGIPRNRPPFPVSEGYLSYPTVVNNVETFAMASRIFGKDGDNFSQLGTEKSRGTKLLSISGDTPKPGIYEFPWGVTIEEIILASGAENTSFVQVGGPAGELLEQSQFSRSLCYEDVATGGSFMIFNASRNPLDVILNFTQFFAHESCGFCTPCRVGTQLNHQLFEKLFSQGAAPRDIEKLEELNLLMDRFSHCGLGKTASHIVKQGLAQFRGQLKPGDDNWSPDFDLEKSLSTARKLRVVDTGAK
jgi:[NiFe] hydrogenase diaphorase moiety large subunit